MTWFRLEFSTLLNVFGSKQSAYSPNKDQTSAREEHMYFPFAEAMNYALERSSDLIVDGLPQFETHIAFVPCNKGVRSDRSKPGSSFKPDIALMSLEDAYKFHGVNQTGTHKLSELIGRIEKVPLSSSINWKAFLSAVEMKRRDAELPPLRLFDRPETQVSVIQDADKRLDEKPDDPPPATCKIDLIS